MNRLIRRAVIATAVTGAIAVPALPAAAAGPVVTGGLVNVTIFDVLNDNQIILQVQAPITVAANICDVTVAVLAVDLSDGTADCSNDLQTITVSQQRR